MNHYNVVLIAFSQEPEPLDSFLGALITRGWNAHVPVSDVHSDPGVITSQVRTWGGFLFPEMRIMTQTGISNVGDTTCLPDFAMDTVQEQAQLLYSIPGDCPGFAAPRIDDAVAVIMAESRCAPPHYWIKAVVDKYYNQGLRFFMLCQDTGEESDGEAHVDVFYSSGRAESKMEDSQLCVGLSVVLPPQSSQSLVLAQ
jgi:hypothetical protein